MTQKFETEQNISGSLLSIGIFIFILKVREYKTYQSLPVGNNRPLTFPFRTTIRDTNPAHSVTTSPNYTSCRHFHPSCSSLSSFLYPTCRGLNNVATFLPRRTMFVYVGTSDERGGHSTVYGGPPFSEDVALWREANPDSYRHRLNNYPSWRQQAPSWRQCHTTHPRMSATRRQNTPTGV